MANFTTITLDGNDKTLLAPNWVALGGANTEVRWSDQPNQKNVPHASWPAMVRPVATGIVSYTYAFSADAVGNGFISQQGAVNCPAFDNGNYLWARWNWDNTGTFASAPIFTAYKSTSYDSPAAGDGSLLGGHVTDTGSRSYLKANVYGQVVSVAAPIAAPTNAPVVTDGTAGNQAGTTGASWMTHYGDLQGDNDYITAGFTPAAGVADQWNVIFALFNGPNLVPLLYLVVFDLKYTWT